MNYIWDVSFKVVNPLIKVTLTNHRLLANGNSIQFDEDPDGILDLANEEDDKFYMDGFLALIPENQRLSCAFPKLSPFWKIWKIFNDLDYQYIPVENKQEIKHIFKDRIWNPDSAAEYVFIGGEKDFHIRSVVENQARSLDKNIRQEDPILFFKDSLSDYNGILYTYCTSVILITYNKKGILEKIENDLDRIASKYRYKLPSRQD